MKYNTSDRLVSKNGVLLNKFGIDDQNELNKKENNITSVQIVKLSIDPIKGSFDLKHLQAIHKHIFDQIYSWAGDIRNIDISKGNSMFATNSRIIPEAEKLFSQLRKENYLKNTEPEKMASRLAYYLGEINAIHPFREGNGRTQRVFISQLAKEAGFELTFDKTTQEEMIQASIAAYFCDYTGLESIIERGLKPLSNHLEKLKL
ncbi:Fic/DOC family protein [Gallibacterium melopsittaci]|uniref:protein adenylyltransferase n=1 Tax=Gallibacterium melopsittaci TaxID=516063 RepID=A0ABV6HU60_9PAST